MNKEIKIITEEHCHIPLNVYAASNSFVET